MKRQIIRIDEDKCNGCGLCVPSCAEGAIKIVDGKARLISERYCDGLGACLGECPQGALSIEEREAPEFDEAAVAAHLKAKEPGREGHAHGVGLAHGAGHAHGGNHAIGGLFGQVGHESGGCPGSRAMAFTRPGQDQRSGCSCAGAGADASAGNASAEGHAGGSELTHWPVQLRLVSPQAPYFKGANLLVAADCVPFAYADFHRKFLRDRAVVIGCPKLDDPDYYVDKLAELIRHNDLTGLTVVHMEVPCCFGLNRIVSAAVAKSGVDVPVQSVMIGIQGEIKA